MLVIFLLPVGRDRFELYSEAPEEQPAAPAHGDGRVRRWAHRGAVRWREVVDAARRGAPGGRLARWRDAIICRLAESIAEQRTLWSLNGQDAVTVLFPSNLDAARARVIVDRLLAGARRHHGRWLIVDLILFIASAVLFFLPGPNIVAYYLAFRVVGHLQSWRGARRGSQRVKWTFEPDANLAELASLVDVPRDARASRVAAIAERLNLPRLSSFFERVTA